MPYFAPLTTIAVNDVIGNLSYMILAASFFVTNMVWLRILAAVAMALEIAYFCLTSWDLYTGVAWNLVFIAINLYRLVEFSVCRRNLRHIRELSVLRNALGKLEDAQLARIVTAGQWTRFDPGGRMIVQGQSGHRLHLICSGEARVELDGQLSGRLRPRDVAGASGFWIAAPANRSVVAETAVKSLSFERQVLAALCERDPHIASAVYKLLGHDLARQLAAPASAFSPMAADQLTV